MTVAHSRMQQLVDQFKDHIEGELVNDVERTLKTLTDDIVYEHPFRDDYSANMKGIDEVRHYYQTEWAKHPFRTIEVLRSWPCTDDTVAVEVYANVEVEGKIVGSKALCFGTFRDGLLCKEVVFNGPLVPVTRSN